MISKPFVIKLDLNHTTLAQSATEKNENQKITPNDLKSLDQYLFYPIPFKHITKMISMLQ